MINELNQDFLNETRRIGEYLQKMVKISGMALFFEPAVRKLMLQEEPSNFEVITGIRRLNSIQSSGLHTHSIHVYNAAKGYVYSTSNKDSDRVEDFYDQGLIGLLSPRPDTRRLAPSPRLIREPSGSTPVCSFVFYESTPGEGGAAAHRPGRPGAGVPFRSLRGTTAAHRPGPPDRHQPQGDAAGQTAVQTSGIGYLFRLGSRSIRIHTSHATVFPEGRTCFITFKSPRWYAAESEAVELERVERQVL